MRRRVMGNTYRGLRKFDRELKEFMRGRHKKPCMFAQDYSGDGLECDGFYRGCVCDCKKMIFDKNSDGTINVVLCGEDKRNETL